MDQGERLFLQEADGPGEETDGQQRSILFLESQHVDCCPNSLILVISFPLCPHIPVTWPMSCCR